MQTGRVLVGAHRKDAPECPPRTPTSAVALGFQSRAWVRNDMRVISTLLSVAAAACWGCSIILVDWKSLVRWRGRISNISNEMTDFTDTNNIVSPNMTNSKPECKDNMTGGILFANISLPEVDGMKAIHLPNKPVGRSNTAFCRLESSPFMTHFPHYMQFILRCWSFFQTQSKQHNVISVPDEYFSRAVSSPNSIFQSGLNAVLSDSLGISIVKSSSVRRFFGRGENSSSVEATKMEKVEFWMASPGHAREFRDRFMNALSLHDDAKFSCNKTLPTIGILNRCSTRSLLNAESVAEALRDEFGMKAAPQITCFETASFRDQVEFFSEHDIVLSPHGAGLAGLPFMPGNGALLEIYPMGYVIPYYFGSLTASLGLDHAYIYETKGDAKKESVYWGSRERRGEARKKNLCIPVPQIVEGVKDLVGRWKRRCSGLKLDNTTAHSANIRRGERGS